MKIYHLEMRTTQCAEPRKPVNRDDEIREQVVRDLDAVFLSMIGIKP